mgnify:CR=1 FL=1
MLRTYQPSKVKRNRKFGFRARMVDVKFLLADVQRDVQNLPFPMKRNRIDY